LTPELVREGLAREVVRRVQDERKNLQLEISDRIEIQYQTSDVLEEAIQAFKEYILGETLCVKLTRVVGDTSTFSQETFDNETLVFQVKKSTAEAA
jgi:isoleucyl-tRNA synthetase